MQIKQTSTVANQTAAQAPKTAAPTPETAAPAPQETVTLAQKNEAQAELEKMAEIRTQLGGALHTQILDHAPGGFKELLDSTTPIFEQAAKDLKEQQGTQLDMNFLIASEAGLLSSAGVNAENRAQIRESLKQPADRAQLFQEELGYLVQTNLLTPMLDPALAQEVANTQVEGEAMVTAKTFVDMALEKAGAPAEFKQQLVAQAAQDPAVQALAANPQWSAQIAESLKTQSAVVAAMGQGIQQYIGQLMIVGQNEMMAQGILQQAQAQGL